MAQPKSIGPYVVVRTLGLGGMGTVYLAVRPPLDRPEAVKVPHQHLQDQPGLRERFQREAMAASRLRHRNIATIYHPDLLHDPPYIAMEYVEGGSLLDLLRRRGSLGVRETADLLGPIASALDHCHEQRQTHRDVKPANVLLGEGGARPVLTDFGIALVEGLPSLTSQGLVLGTARYLSPEQAAGASAGPASDLYALACVAFECLTGSPPFVRGSDGDTVRAHIDDRPPGASVLNPALGPGVDALLAVALGKDPVARRTRFPTVSGFTDELRAQVATPVLRVPAPATQPLALPRQSGPPPPPTPPAARVRPGWLGAALSALVLAPVAFLAADALFDRSGTGAGAVTATAEIKVDLVAAAVKPGAPPLTTGQRALLEQGPVRVLFDCVGQPTIEKGRTSAAVGCASRIPGVDGLLLRQSEPGGGLRQVMDSPKRPAGDCSREVGVDGSWALGPLDCYDNETEAVAALWWGYVDSGINVIAVRKDGDNRALYNWFTRTDWTAPSGPPG